jgi:hypothetical protein
LSRIIDTVWWCAACAHGNPLGWLRIGTEKGGVDKDSPRSPDVVHVMEEVDSKVVGSEGIDRKFEIELSWLSL